MAMSVVCSMTLRRTVVLGGVFMAGMVMLVARLGAGLDTALAVGADLVLAMIVAIVLGVVF